MSKLRTQTVSVTTAANGTGAATGRAILGVLRGIRWNKGSAADGVDATITIANSDFTDTLLTLTDANASAWYYLRTVNHGATGTASAAVAELPIVIGAPVLTIAQGGNAKTCSITLVYSDD